MKGPDSESGATQESAVMKPNTDYISPRRVRSGGVVMGSA